MQAILWVMKHGASIAFVENGHGTFGGYVERFGKLHDDAGTFIHVFIPRSVYSFPFLHYPKEICYICTSLEKLGEVYE